MNRLRLVASSVAFLAALSQSVRAQQPLPTATKDPQAVAVLTQTLVAAGGLSALAAIQDVTGTGQITYFQPQNFQSSVTVRGRELDQFRLDATLPSGISAQAISNGQMTVKLASGKVIPINSDAPPHSSRVFLPYIFLSAALNGPEFGLSYKGVVQLDGHSVVDIEVQEVVPDSVHPSGLFPEYHTIGFFIDASTFQVAMMQDTVPNHLVRQTRYSAYGTVSGILVPHAITQQSGGLQTWTIQLNQITLNNGLQDSDFQL
jgi:hypothetical protein